MEAERMNGGRVVQLDAYRALKTPTPPVVTEGVDYARVQAVVAWSALADAMETAELEAAVSAWRRRRPA